MCNNRLSNVRHAGQDIITTGRNKMKNSFRINTFCSFNNWEGMDKLDFGMSFQILTWTCKRSKSVLVNT